MLSATGIVAGDRRAGARGDARAPDRSRCRRHRTRGRDRRHPRRRTGRLRGLRDDHRGARRQPSMATSIMVTPGTYIEAITITKDMTLAGEGGRDKVVIEIPSDAPTAEFDDGSVIPCRGSESLASDATTQRDDGQRARIRVRPSSSAGGSRSCPTSPSSSTSPGAATGMRIAFLFIGASKPILDR